MEPILIVRFPSGYSRLDIDGMTEGLEKESGIDHILCVMNNNKEETEIRFEVLGCGDIPEIDFQELKSKLMEQYEEVG